MKPRRRKTGFTFMELLTALYILTIVAVFVLELFIATSRHTLRSREYWVALFLAQSKIESLAGPSLDRRFVDQGGYVDRGYNVVVADASSSGHFDSPYDNYQYSLQVSREQYAFKFAMVTVTSPHGVQASMRLLY